MFNRTKALWHFLIHREFAEKKYTYGFSYLGLPILKLPQDVQALQEIIWKVKPDIIIETGIANGGSLVFFASMLELLGNGGKVIGVEINLYPENKKKILEHPMSKNIIIIEGSSLDEETYRKIYPMCLDKKVLVCLDSNHTEEHVFKELNGYAQLVSVGSYIVVDDTGIEDLPDELSKDRPWGKGNNPKTAVWRYLKGDKRFVIDKEIEEKIIFTGSPDGYLRRIK